MASSDPHPQDAAHAVDEYALVAYVPSPLGPYLDAVRRRIAPWMPPGRAHVTVLSPRPLDGNAGRAWSDLKRQLVSAPRFEVEATEIRVFDPTRVIYLDIGEGSEALRRLHAFANQGLFAYQDPYPYHPHITLAQEIPPARFDETLERAKSLWGRYKGPRRFAVERLHFVQNTVLNLWMDLDSIKLAADGHSKSLI